MKNLLYLSLLATAALAIVESVTSLDQFYGVVNNFNATNPTYTVVKYYTNWCSHCKKLKPVFEQLSESSVLSEVDIVDPALTSGVDFAFFEVDCELFGNMLCKRLDGFPAVEIIKPLRSELNVTRLEDPRGWIDRLLDTITNAGYDLTWTLDTDRIVTFNGRRNLDVFERFIQAVVTSDQWDRVLQLIVNDNCSDKDKLCEDGREYFLKMNDETNYAEKIADVESEMKNLKDIPKDLMLKYMILNKISELNNEEPLEQDEL
ncbi:Mpd2 [Kluyveromyces lactis]|nr:Mpd2 [Kluyveromyces lactis]